MCASSPLPHAPPLTARTPGNGIQNLFLTASVPIFYWVVPIPLAVGLLVLDESRKLVVRELWPVGK